MTTLYFFLSNKFTKDTPKRPKPPVTKNFLFNFKELILFF